MTNLAAGPFEHQYDTTPPDLQAQQPQLLPQATADRLREQHLVGRVYPGPVDTAIYSIDDGHCIADRMASEGVYRTPAHKDAGSRQNGWELLRERLKNVMKPEGPRFFVFNTCR